MATSKQPRAPTKLRQFPNGPVLAGIDWQAEAGPQVFLRTDGIEFEKGKAEIYLSAEELQRLAPWIARAAAWAKGGK